MKQIFQLYKILFKLSIILTVNSQFLNLNISLDENQKNTEKNAQNNVSNSFKFNKQVSNSFAKGQNQKGQIKQDNTNKQNLINLKDNLMQNFINTQKQHFINISKISIVMMKSQIVNYIRKKIQNQQSKNGLFSVGIWMLDTAVNVVDSYNLNSPPVEDYFDVKTQQLMEEAMGSLRDMTTNYLYGCFF